MMGLLTHSLDCIPIGIMKDFQVMLNVVFVENFDATLDGVGNAIGSDQKVAPDLILEFLR